MIDLLSPVFAAVGLAAATLPFVLHMLRRMPAARMRFSAVRFLGPSPPQVTRRSRIEHWPLMLLRILALALIALAFARPFQRVATIALAATGMRERVALLVDGSASMRRDGIRDAVVREIRAAVGAPADNDVLSIAQFSRSVTTVLSAEEWQRHDPATRSALIEEFVDTYQPDWLDTRTGAALLSVAEDVAAELPGGGEAGLRRIVLITDFQRGSRLDELRAATWPAGVAVELRIVQARVSGNAGLSLAEPGPDGQVRVHLTSAADTEVTEFQLQPRDAAGDAVGPTIPVSVTAGQGRTIEIPLTVPAPGVRAAPATPPVPAGNGGHAAVAGLELQNDPHEFDNRLSFPPVEGRVLRIAWVGADDPNDPTDMRYYLQRAVDGSDAEQIELVDTISSAGTRPVDDGVRLVIATDVVPQDLVPSIRHCLDHQGVLLVALRSAEMATSISELLPHPLQVSETVISDYAMLGQIDFASPLFASFAEIRFSDFSSIRFWHTRLITVNAAGGSDASNGYSRIASFDSGAPAILEATTPQGGRIFLLASGWHPHDSQLALSTRFAPLIISLVRLSHPPAIRQPLRTVGDEIPVSTLLGSLPWRAVLPDGSEVVSDVADPVRSESTRNSLRLTMPGRYTITGPLTAGSGEAPEPLTIIAWLAASESRTEPLPIGQLQALGVSAELVSGSGESRTESGEAMTSADLHASELESRQKLWRVFLLAGLACLMLESLFAAGIERHRKRKGRT